MKKAFSESLDKNELQRMQCGSSLKSAKHKVEVLKKVIAENSPTEHDGVPSSKATVGGEDALGDYQPEEDCSLNDFSSVVDRVYAENRKKAAASRARFQQILGNCPPGQASTSRQHQEEAMQIVQETYERGLKLLPTLVRAMTIQRRKQQEEMDQTLEAYESTLNEWERKVSRYEKNPKKM